MRDNLYTHARLGDEAVDQVQTDIRTYRLEQDYIEMRRQRVVLPALQELCPGADRPINIAIVASGGGSRAMFATYGALKGLLDIGVLNATSYICGLSGSTWAISSIFTRASRFDDRDARTALAGAIANSIEQAPGFSFISAAITAPIRRSTIDFFSDDPTAVKLKKLLHQPVTNTDYYGASIARYLNGRGNDVYENTYMPDYLTLQLGRQAQWQRKNFELPQAYMPLLPFPIYTAVTPLYNTESRFTHGLNLRLIK